RLAVIAAGDGGTPVRLLDRTSPPVTVAASPMTRLLLLVPVLLAFFACSRSERAGDRLVVAIESPPETLDRRMALGANAMRVAQLITPGLTRVDETGRAVPDLAASFEPID